MKNKDNYVNLTKIIVIWILATISSLILDYFKIRVENILLIYVVGVLISIIETSNNFSNNLYYDFQLSLYRSSIYFFD